MNLTDWWRKVKPYVPQNLMPAIRFLYRFHENIFWWYKIHIQPIFNWHRDQRLMKLAGFNRLPNASLRYRVHGFPDLDGFLRVGKVICQDIEISLQKIGKKLDSSQNILDFGCGCGRTLIWFGKNPNSAHFYGTDIDAKAISWCRENLPFCTFSINNDLPPLEYASNSFDLIYSISVFTHLIEEYQFKWLSELKRIIKPDGIALITLHGENVWKTLSNVDIIKMKKNGFLSVPSYSWKGIFPEWYQNSYHTREYVIQYYANFFDILEYIPCGLNNHQDIVILIKT
jgi:SAM-dependent methyltransferase